VDRWSGRNCKGIHLLHVTIASRDPPYDGRPVEEIEWTIGRFGLRPEENFLLRILIQAGSVYARAKRPLKLEA
jgi:hypothetical protein